MASEKLGQRNSKKRDQIVEAINAASGPVSVNDIHDALEEGGNPVGIATIYRTIKLLLEAEHITDVVFADGVHRYELSELGHHHHFVCEACDKVFDLPDCQIKDHAHELGNGFKVKSHDITYYGVCGDCDEEKPS